MKTQTSARPAAGDRINRLVAKIVLTAAMLLVPAVFLFGDSGPSRNLSGVSLGGLFPAGAFSDHVSQKGLGLGVYYGRRAGRSPVYIGLELTLDVYGYVRRHEYLEGIPEVRLDVETLNNISQGLLFVRLQPRQGTVTTYVEGLAGISYLFTETTISGHEYPYDEISSDTNFDDVTWTAGAGAGLSVRLSRRHVQDSDHWWKETFLDFKVRYMAGGRAKYLKQGSIVVEGDQFTYASEQSATSFITAQVAISWLF